MRRGVVVSLVAVLLVTVAVLVAILAALRRVAPLQAVSGIMSVVGNDVAGGAVDDPIKVSFPVVDMTGGLMAVQGIMMALFARESWCDLSHALIFHGRRACKARMSANGTGQGILGAGTMNAKVAAILAFEAAATKAHGSRYGKFDKATDAKFDCRSGTLKARCVVTARPCR